MTITLSTYAEAREALRSRHLRQALYDEGAVVMDGVIVNLHGEEHLARRRLENRLFRRDTFAWYEAERIPSIIADVLAGPLAAGRGDLLPLARQTMTMLSVDIAGIDRPTSEGQAQRLDALMGAMARAATVAHAAGDKEQIKARGAEALSAFATEFHRPSWQRRRALVDRWRRGEIGADELPRDVLTTLLVNHDRLDLTPEIVLREVAYYPWVGSHSTSNQLVHAMHHVFDWIEQRPESREALTADDRAIQRFVHESIRLHPASPVAVRAATAAVTLRSSGRQLPAGERIVIDMEAANRDETAVGPDPDSFDPRRQTAADVPPWGLSFGTGTHSCLGQDLAAGLVPDDHSGRHLVGAITAMVSALLSANARPDPDDPPQGDASTTRAMWGRYPVLLG